MKKVNPIFKTMITNVLVFYIILDMHIFFHRRERHCLALPDMVRQRHAYVFVTCLPLARSRGNVALSISSHVSAGQKHLALMGCRLDKACIYSI
jgi:hypothetical protein